MILLHATLIFFGTLFAIGVVLALVFAVIFGWLSLFGQEPDEHSVSHAKENMGSEEIEKKLH